MFRHIDCALLAVPAFDSWARRIQANSAIHPVRVEHMLLHEGADWCGDVQPRAAYDEGARLALMRAGPALQRFDVCLLPVMPSTLAWTRVALASGHEALPVPLLVLARGLTAPALRDLLGLGAADFVHEAAGAEELKARITQWAGKRAMLCQTRAGAGDDGARAANAAGGRVPPPAFALTLRQLSAPQPLNDSYRASRAQVLADFERDYVTSMLVRYRGNVTHAARAGSQDRRAFWQLMRKYSILSADYRTDGVTSRHAAVGRV